MRQFLNALAGRRRAKPPPDQEQTLANVLQPDAPFFAVGDIHGRVDLLMDLLSRIDPNEDQQIVFLGDYVDRGADSAKTLRFLYEVAQRRPDQVVCLMGNHEKMMCEFIDDPLDRGARWLRNGGLATLASFGITGLAEKPTPDRAMEACDQLEAAIPKEVLDWLVDLPLSWHSGNVWCAHAAMDPDAPPQTQRSKTMLWGHPAFLKSPREDGICVVHGHTIVDQPFNANSRIAVDTGAHRTGRLTAAYIAPQTCEFIST